MRLIELFCYKNILGEERVFVRGYSVIVYKNISYEVLLGLVRKRQSQTVETRDVYGFYRGLIVGNDLYWWDGYYSNHFDMAQQLGLGDFTEVWVQPYPLGERGDAVNALEVQGYSSDVISKSVAVKRLAMTKGGENLYIRVLVNDVGYKVLPMRDFWSFMGVP